MWGIAFVTSVMFFYTKLRLYNYTKIYIFIVSFIVTTAIFKTVLEFDIFWQINPCFFTLKYATKLISGRLVVIRLLKTYSLRF